MSCLYRLHSVSHKDTNMFGASERSSMPGNPIRPTRLYLFVPHGTFGIAEISGFWRAPVSGRRAALTPGGQLSSGFWSLWECKWNYRHCIAGCYSRRCVTCRQQQSFWQVFPFWIVVPRHFSKCAWLLDFQPCRPGSGTLAALKVMQKQDVCCAARAPKQALHTYAPALGAAQLKRRRPGPLVPRSRGQTAKTSGSGLQVQACPASKTCKLSILSLLKSDLGFQTVRPSPRTTLALYERELQTCWAARRAAAAWAAVFVVGSVQITSGAPQASSTAGPVMLGRWPSYLTWQLFLLPFGHVWCASRGLETNVQSRHAIHGDLQA